MENQQQETRSLWQTLDPPHFPVLAQHETVDVCVVGAGIAGLTTAYHLLVAGKTVAVLERDKLFLGQTGLTTAHLSHALDERYFTLRRMHGRQGARLAFDSHRWAIEEIERIVGAEAIDCDFRRLPGYLFLGPDESETYLRKELEAAHDAGFTDVEFLEAAPGPLRTGPCLRFPHQGQFHVTRYLAGLAAAVRRRGGRIFTHTEVTSVEGGRPARVSTQRGFQVVCEAVVMATNVPVNDRVTMYTKMAPYRTYAVGLRLREPPAETALYWDSADPYHYVRTQKDADGSTILIVGGEDHRTGQDPQPGDRFARLVQWSRERLGLVGETRYRWSGQVNEPHDGLAYIGRNPGDEDNVFITTGDSGHGMTHGTITGALLTDLILDRENPWATLYDPARVNLRSLSTISNFVAENMQSTAPYGDWLSPGDVSSLDEIAPGEGAVLREGVQKLACYVDEHRRPHFFSAVCPHLQGIVRWNSTEKTWDCPCHGSRFDKHGNVINGPANVGLRAVIDPTLPQQESASA